MSLPLSVYVALRFFSGDGSSDGGSGGGGGGHIKFVDHVKRRVPKRKAIIVQEEIERKYVWMNMWPAKNGAYDPLTYDVRRTVSVRLMIHGPWIEFKFPRRNLPLRRMYGDPEPAGVAFLEHKEVVDLTNCSIELIPENLPTKRVWSKKYPIRIRTNVRKLGADGRSSAVGAGTGGAAAAGAGGGGGDAKNVVVKPNSGEERRSGQGVSDPAEASQEDPPAASSSSKESSPKKLLPDGPVDIEMKPMNSSVRMRDLVAAAAADVSDDDDDADDESGDSTEEEEIVVDKEKEVEEKEEEEKDPEVQFKMDPEQPPKEGEDLPGSNEGAKSETVIADKDAEGEKDKAAGEDEADQGHHQKDDAPFEILGVETKTFFLFARTSREKEEWFNRLTVGCHFMRDWNLQNPAPSNSSSSRDAKDGSPTHKVREQRFRIFMENYFQARHSEGAQRVHQMTRDDDSKRQVAREQVAFLNIVGARLWHDLHGSRAFVDLLREKITRKLLKVKIAQYFNDVSVPALDLGQRLPQVLSASLPWQDEMGLWVDLEVEYSGVCQATVHTRGIRLPGKDEPDREAQELADRRQAATVDSEEEDSAEEDDEMPDSAENTDPSDLNPSGAPGDAQVHGSGFRVRMLEGLLRSDFVAKVAESEWVKKNITGKDITLQLQLHAVRGTLTVNLPPAPSDRVWYGFRRPPQLELALRPCFGGRGLGKYESTFAAVMRQLEKRLKQEFMKVLVYPNMDDEVLPFLEHVDYSITA